jgi:phage shock protein A
MSIFSRLSNVFKSNLNAAIDKVSDPAKEIDYLVDEMDEEIKKLRLELRDALVQEKMAQKRVDEAFRGVQKWQDHAERAVRAGDDELAKEALLRQSESEGKLAALENTLAEHSRVVAKLQDELRLGEEKLTEIRGKREVLKARARSAKKEVEKDDSAFGRFNRLVDEIEEKEHQAEAMAELDPTLRAASQSDRDRQTEARFSHLLERGDGSGQTETNPGGALVLTGKNKGRGLSEKDRAMEARLAALKAKLDKPKADE